MSATASRPKRPRRFTHGPRLVETVTSGDVGDDAVGEGARFPRRVSFRIWPKPCCVEATGCAGTVSLGTAMSIGRAAAPGAALCEGHAVEKGLQIVPRGVASPSNGSHSCPGRMFIAWRKVSICASVMRPAWLSL